MIKISDIGYYSQLFAKLTELISNRNEFYSKVVEIIWNEKDLERCVLVLQGVFSGCVMQYFKDNKEVHDNANEHGGLYVFAMEMNPSMRFEEINHLVKTLDELKRIEPDNENIQYLCDLRDNTPKMDLAETDIYYFGVALFEKLKEYKLFDEISDIVSYSVILYWLININPLFNLSKNVSLEKLWENHDKYSIDTISSILYTCFCGNKDYYEEYVEKNLLNILTYLREVTKSLTVYTTENKESIHVEYILLTSSVENECEESVSRLKNICKMLTILDNVQHKIKPKTGS